MDRFQLIRELGRGAMGVVYQAVQLELQRDVALKLISAELGQDADVRKRFEREASTLARLDHPGIVRVFDFGVSDDGQMYYAMELLRGNDLWEHVEDCQKLPLAEVLSVLVQAADALAYLADQKLTHRDVKPANLFLETDGRVVLTDFGLVSSKDLRSVSTVASVVGSPRFLPPEVVRGLGSSPAQDVWALAITAFELLSGRPWTRAAHISDVFSEILKGAKPDFSGTGAPEWFVQLTQRALETNPAQRITAAEYRDALQAKIDAADRRGLTLISEKLPSRLLRVPAMGGLPGTPPPRSRDRSGMSGRSRVPGAAASGRVAVPGRVRKPRGRFSIGPAALIVAALAVAGAAFVYRPAGTPAATGAGSASAPASPAGSVGVAATLTGSAFLAPPSPSGHRRLELRLSPELPAGARVEAWDAGRRVAFAPVGTLERTAEGDSRRAALSGLPPARALELRVAVGEQVVATQTYSTPRIDPVTRLSCYPSEQDVVVDFTLETPSACVVELQKEGDATAQRVELASARGHRHVFRELKPLSRYQLRVRLPSGWGGMGAYTFTTLGPQRGAEIAQWLSHMQDDAQMASWFSTFDATPDLRMSEYFRKLLPSTQPSQSATLRRIAQVVGPLADRETAELLLPFVDRIGTDAPHSRAALIEALARVRHPRAAELARKYIDQSDDPAALLGCSFALAEMGGKENAQAILAALARRPARVELAPLAARADPELARATFREWLAANAGQSARAPAAVAGLGWIGEPAVDDLAAACRAAPRSATANGAAEALAAIPGPRSEAALVEVCRALPPESRRVWIAARRGLTVLAPDVARWAEQSGGAARRDAYCALGLLGETSERARLFGALEDPDREIAAAAAWALLRMGERTEARALDRLRDAVVGSPDLLSPNALTDRRQSVTAALERIDPRRRGPDERIVVPITTWERTGVDALPGDALQITVEPIAEPPTGARPRMWLMVGGQPMELKRGRQAYLVTRPGEALIYIESPSNTPNRIVNAMYRLTVRRGE